MFMTQYCMPHTILLITYHKRILNKQYITNGLEIGLRRAEIAMVKEDAD